MLRVPGVPVTKSAFFLLSDFIQKFIQNNRTKITKLRYFLDNIFGWLFSAKKNFWAITNPDQQEQLFTEINVFYPTDVDYQPQTKLTKFSLKKKN